MSEAARKAVHELVDELPEDELPEVRSILEAKVRNGDALDQERAERLAAMKRIEKSWQGQPSTTAEQVDKWTRQSRP